MGLLDIIHGMENGPRGQRQPPAPGTTGGGMSKTTMVLLGLLAYKAYKNFGAQAAQPAFPAPGSSGGGNAGGGGTLADILGGLFGGSGTRTGGPFGGVAPGNVLSRGLGNLLEDLQKSGHGEVAQSWINRGPNQEISPNKLEAALGDDTLDALTKQTGMNRDELLVALSQYLPGVVDHLTPNGRLPSEEEASRMV
jgi:uncharacterized protein YidB (DUF937 family)